MGAFYLISGNEDYAVKERANEMMRALCGDPPDDNPSLEIIRGDSDNEKAPQVLDKLLLSLDSPAFFSSEKIVWLKQENTNGAFRSARIVQYPVEALFGLFFRSISLCPIMKSMNSPVSGLRS